jgi:hypothetical protein
MCSLVHVKDLRNQLGPMPSLWRGIEEDLIELGVRPVSDLKAQEPGQLTLCYRKHRSRPFDEFIHDAFVSIVAFCQ